ncbi:hypothetical protein EMCG_04316 [[Emmonsia] crescens]|uniref:Uncharacterized protein n=1 Tax=[Emmonsia] crescens TaxID=73230 RepID=A0A0G2HSH6_9EURO|nr:hypothetical protein EMCG_04316 [Emmonsia crescens UAMH 3008]
MGVAESKIFATEVLILCDKAEKEGRAELDATALWSKTGVEETAKCLFKRIPQRIRGRTSPVDKAASRSSSRITLPKDLRGPFNTWKGNALTFKKHDEPVLSGVALDLSLVHSYLLLSKIEKQQIINKVRLRFFCVALFRLKEILQNNHCIKDVVSCFAHTVHCSDLVGDQGGEILDKFHDWVDRGERYNLLAEELKGLGMLFLLPEDVGEYIWIREMPKERGHEKRINMIQSLRQRSICEEAETIGAHGVANEITNLILQPLLLSMLEVLQSQVIISGGRVLYSTGTSFASGEHLTPTLEPVSIATDAANQVMQQSGTHYTPASVSEQASTSIKETTCIGTDDLANRTDFPSDIRNEETQCPQSPTRTYVPVSGQAHVPQKRPCDFTSTSSKRPRISSRITSRVATDDGHTLSLSPVRVGSVSFSDDNNSQQSPGGSRRCSPSWSDPFHGEFTTTKKIPDGDARRNNSREQSEESRRMVTTSAPTPTETVFSRQQQNAGTISLQGSNLTATEPASSRQQQNTGPINRQSGATRNFGETIDSVSSTIEPGCDPLQANLPATFQSHTLDLWVNPDGFPPHLDSTSLDCLLENAGNFRQTIDVTSAPQIIQPSPLENSRGIADVSRSRPYINSTNFDLHTNSVGFQPHLKSTNLDLMLDNTSLSLANHWSNPPNVYNPQPDNSSVNIDLQANPDGYSPHLNSINLDWFLENADSFS